jgi:hypothetical protein
MLSLFLLASAVADDVPPRIPPRFLPVALPAQPRPTSQPTGLSELRGDALEGPEPLVHPF